MSVPTCSKLAAATIPKLELFTLRHSPCVSAAFVPSMQFLPSCMCHSLLFALTAPYLNFAASCPLFQPTVARDMQQTVHARSSLNSGRCCRLLYLQPLKLFFEAEGSVVTGGSVFTSQFVQERLLPLGYTCHTRSFPLFNHRNFNNATDNMFGPAHSFMVSCAAAAAAPSPPPGASAAPAEL
jgi:hypothetical protein